MTQPIKLCRCGKPAMWLLKSGLINVCNDCKVKGVGF